MIKQIIIILMVMVPAMVGAISDESVTEDSSADSVGYEYTAGLVSYNDSKMLIVADYVQDKSVTIASAISNGLPVLSKNSDDFEDVGSIAFYDNSNYYGYYKSNGVTYCYSVEYDNPNKAYAMAIEWASNIEKKSTISPVSIEDGTVVVSEKETQCDNRGIFTISTVYTYAGRDDGWDYWTVKYYMESNPQNGSQTRSMKIYDDLNVVGVEGKLLRHGPNTTSGSSTSTVSVTLSADGGSASIGTSYSIPDVKVINDSSIAKNMISITHEISSNKDAAEHTYYCEPIAIFKCDPGDSDTAFCPVDEYSIKYAKNEKILGYFDHWTDKTYDVRLNAILYPDR